MDKLDFPGVVLTRTAEVLVVHSQQPLTVLSSAVVGGGMVRVRYLLNRHVHHDYNCLDPERIWWPLPGVRASVKRLWAR